jgi:hypothetical protein
MGRLVPERGPASGSAVEALGTEFDRIATLNVDELRALWRATMGRPVSQTKEGHFFKLASLLFAIASGEEEKDISAYCEDLDRVEPLYVVKIPNVLGS